MAKFVKPSDTPSALNSGTPIPQNHVVAPQQPATATTPQLTAQVEAAMQVVEHKEVARAFEDIRDDGEKRRDTDKPSNKDYDIASHTNQVGGMRQYMNDALTRQLNCTMYLIDVAKYWGPNPLGGRPVPVTYSREFPEIKVLYDSIGASPETNTRELVERMVAVKRDLAHANGFRYIFQHGWETLNSDNLTRQLAAEDSWKASQKK